MLSRRVAISLFTLLVLLPAACKKKPAVPPDVIARVGERTLALADFKRYLERNAGTDLAQLTPEVSSAVLDQFVDEIIVSEYAAAHGIEVPAEQITAAVRTEAGVTVLEKRDEMRREKLVAKLTGEIADANDATVREYYQKHRNEFRSAEEVRVRQILVNDEKTAGEIRAKLLQGARFEDLSAEYSRAPNARNGGEIGYVSRGELPNLFEDVIFNLEPGQISDVIRTDSSFHIFRVEGRRPAGTLSLDAAAPVIRARLREDALRDRLQKIITTSRREMAAAVLTRRLPFAYSGSLTKSEDE